MLNVYCAAGNRLVAADCAGGLPPDMVWIDLCSPSLDEEERVEHALGIDVPTREDMQEIEHSSRLYQDQGTLFMTATILLGSETAAPETVPITFILMQDLLITVRYAEPRSFATVLARLQRPGGAESLKPEAIFAELMEALIDRAADILERITLAVDETSRGVFQEGGGKPTRARDYHSVLQAIGREGDLLSKARESIVSIGRRLSFLTAAGPHHVADEVKARIATMVRDTQSIADHASFVASKMTFLLDATLGLVNIEQNAIIKIFSVVAVVFLPPTLVASIYGMNFEYMPELDWLLGYPFALLLMIASAILPYVFFKKRGWL